MKEIRIVEWIGKDVSTTWPQAHINPGIHDREYFLRCGEPYVWGPGDFWCPMPRNYQIA